MHKYTPDSFLDWVGFAQNITLKRVFEHSARYTMTVARPMEYHIHNVFFVKIIICLPRTLIVQTPYALLPFSEWLRLYERVCHVGLAGTGLLINEPKIASSNLFFLYHVFHEVIMKIQLLILSLIDNAIGCNSIEYQDKKGNFLSDRPQQSIFCYLIRVIN